VLREKTERKVKTRGVKTNFIGFCVLLTGTARAYTTGGASECWHIPHQVRPGTVEDAGDC